MDVRIKNPVEANTLREVIEQATLDFGWGISYEDFEDSSLVYLSDGKIRLMTLSLEKKRDLSFFTACFVHPFGNLEKSYAKQYFDHVLEMVEERQKRDY